MRGTISAGSNFGVGRSHEPKYPAARKRRSFCGLCSVGVISGERHSLYFLLHAPHFRMHSRLVGTLVFTDFPRPCCSHCRPLPTTGGRETGENILTIVSASGIIEHRQAERDSWLVRVERVAFIVFSLHGVGKKRKRDVSILIKRESCEQIERKETKECA